MGENVERLKAELARQGFALSDEDLRAVAEILAAARAGLAKARVQPDDEPEVPCGFIPPSLLPQAPPDGGGR